MIRSHLVHLAIYSAVVATFFSALVRRRRREQVKMFLWTFGGMAAGALLLAFLMFPFPG
jgi:drug/metabolite transporter (DMT)-like permease